MSKKNGSKSFADLFVQAEKRPEYWIAGLEIEFTEELCRVMEERGVSRAELARRAGTSPAYITKILRGGTNFTLATMAKLARALGMDVRLHLAPRGSRTVWKDELSAPASWPERRPVLRQSLEGALVAGGGSPMAAGDVPERHPAQVSTAVLSATVEGEGDLKHEGPAGQAA